MALSKMTLMKCFSANYNRVAATVTVRYASSATQAQLKDRSVVPDLAVENHAPNMDFKHEFETARPFSEIPGMTGFETFKSVLHLIFVSGFQNSHMVVEEKFERFGPIFLEKLGGMTMVYVKDLEAIENMHRLEGKYPQRIVIEPWRHWRDKRGLARGILTGDGEDWKRMRSQLDKRMMRPKHVATYADNFNEVVTDFIDRLYHLRETVGGGVTVPNLDKELFHWSLETIGTVLFEMRLGGLHEDRTPEIAEFIAAVHGVFLAIERIIYFPPKVAKTILPRWYKLHEDSWEKIFATVKKLIDAKVAEIAKTVERGEEVDGFLSALIASEKLSQGEIYANISELMTGAVDTTSNTMQWIMYELAHAPEIQERVHKEVMAQTDGRIPRYDDVKDMSLLKSVIKEVLRMYPVAGVSSRVLAVDLALCGYQVPKGTTVLAHTWSTGRDPAVYPDARKFKPERWLRDSQNKNTHTFAWLPFGFGPRMCVGRRVAELEMQLLLARLMQKFRLEPANDIPLNAVTRGLLIPDKAVEVNFIDRK